MQELKSSVAKLKHALTPKSAPQALGAAEALVLDVAEAKLEIERVQNESKVPALRGVAMSLNARRVKWLGLYQDLGAAWLSGLKHAAECWYWKQFADHTTKKTPLPTKGEALSVEQVHSSLDGVAALFAAIRLYEEGRFPEKALRDLAFKLSTQI